MPLNGNSVDEEILLSIKNKNTYKMLLLPKLEELMKKYGDVEIEVNILCLFLFVYLQSLSSARNSEI